MSEQIGSIRLKGNIGGISFFESDGKHRAKRAAGPGKERILTGKNFERTRENNCEFGGSAMVSKAFRQTFDSLQFMADARISGRFTALFKKINLNGRGIRGKRSIDLSLHRTELVNIEFNVNRSLTTMFTGSFSTTRSEDRRQATITIDEVLVKNALVIPEGASHVQFIHSMGVLSDYNYNEGLKRYVPVNAAADKLNRSTTSAYIPLNLKTPLALTLTTQLPGDAVLDENISVLQCFGVTYYQMIGMDYHPVPNTGVVKVIRVY